MQKMLIVVVMTICGVFALLAGCGSTGDAGARSANNPAQSRAEEEIVYYSGDGGKGKSMTILMPAGQGIAAEQNYLPGVTQGEFVANFSKYSAIAVLDRQTLGKVLQETESGIYQSEEDFISLGKITNTDYTLTGNLTKTGSGYAVQVQVTGNTDGKIKASYSGACTAAELENYSAIRKASAELLGKLGVALTEQAKEELSRAATEGQVMAQTALVRGITAQKNGMIVEAMSNYYNAAMFDPGLLEAAKLSSEISATVTSGNVGQRLLNDIQLRNEWLKILQEAAVYFKAHPPFEIWYDPVLEQGDIDYSKRTVDIFVLAGVVAQESGRRMLLDLKDGYDKVKKADWGIGDWPFSGRAAVFDREYQRFDISLELKNENGVSLGTKSQRLTVKADYHESYPYDIRQSLPLDINGSGTFSFTEGIVRFTFPDIDPSMITDKLRVSITDINGMDAKTAGDSGFIRINSGDLSWVRFYEFQYTGNSGDIVITKYNQGRDGEYYKAGNTVIPAKMCNFTVTGIGGKGIDIVTFDRTFNTNPGSSITIPANIMIKEMGPPSSFVTAYNRNGRKAGTYTAKEDRTWAFTRN